MGKRQKKAEAAEAMERHDESLEAEAARAVDAEEPIDALDGESVGTLDAEATPPSEVEQLSVELAELKDRHLRLAAEYDNFRKRTAREGTEARLRAQAEMVRALVDELDDLDRVSQLDPGQASAKDVLDGVLLVERKIWRQLEVLGLERVGEPDEPFDPNVHEAMGSVPTEETERDQTVARVFQPGYRMGGFLVRPARVQVYVHGG